ncbi:MAG: aconitase X [Proteobacteria bacterium]|nr:aconitase X [Pseudomonadota bacterium]
MRLSDQDKAVLDGAKGDVDRQAMEALVQLGEAFDAEDMVDIGYAHVHAGMAMYLGDVELMEELAERGARMAVPASTNIANADMENWQATRAPESLVRLQKRAETAHNTMGTGGCLHALLGRPLADLEHPYGVDRIRRHGVLQFGFGRPIEP